MQGKETINNYIKTEKEYESSVTLDGRWYWHFQNINEEEKYIKYFRADLVKQKLNKIIELCTDEHGEPYDNLFEQIVKIANSKMF